MSDEVIYMGESFQQDLFKEIKVNSMGVVIREWTVTVKILNTRTNDYTYISTSIYHTNEAMAKTEGVKKLQQRLNLEFEMEDWGYTVTATEVQEEY